MKIHASPKKVGYFLLGIAFFLVILSVIVNVFYQLGYCDEGIGLMAYKNFNVDAERNVPTYFSSLNLFFSSMLMVLCFGLNMNRSKKNFTWLFLSAVFLFLSFDEMTEVHEAFAEIMRGVGIGGPGRFYYAVWTIPYLVFGLIVLLVAIRFLRTLPRYLMIAYIQAGIIFVAGAVGFDVALSFVPDMSIHVIFFSIEEFMEMSAVIYFIYATLRYIKLEFKSIKVAFVSEKTARID